MFDLDSLPGSDAVDRLAHLVAQSRRLFVLTGAGCSTESGIPDYRDETGAWKTRPPVRYREFVRSARVRRRYWARSYVGFSVMADARPNAAHRALARLERTDRVVDLVTQNVDGLHQRAGSRRVVDLHGRIDEVECLACAATLPRADLQHLLALANPRFEAPDAVSAPDGDARVEVDTEAFEVVACPRCGGVLKPSVVFFGESVPSERVETSFASLAAADAVLVVGSSLMVFSGYRFVRAAVRAGTPVAVVNLGRTRADDEIDLKVPAPCGRVLTDLCRRVA